LEKRSTETETLQSKEREEETEVPVTEQQKLPPPKHLRVAEKTRMKLDIKRGRGRRGNAHITIA